MEFTADELWSRVLEATRDRLPGQTYRTWLADTVAVGVTDSEILIEVPSQFHVEWMGDRYGPLLTDVTGLMQGTYETGLKLAFPVMAATFLIHTTMGVLGRLVPQINIMLLSFPVTIAMGLLVLGLGLPFITLVFQDSIVGLETTLWELLQELGRG